MKFKLMNHDDYSGVRASNEQIYNLMFSHGCWPTVRMRYEY